MKKSTKKPIIKLEAEPEVKETSKPTAGQPATNCLCDFMISRRKLRSSFARP